MNLHIQNPLVRRHHKHLHILNSLQLNMFTQTGISPLKESLGESILDFNLYSNRTGEIKLQQVGQFPIFSQPAKGNTENVLCNETMLNKT